MDNRTVKRNDMKKKDAEILVRKTFKDTETADIVVYHLFRFWKAWKRLARDDMKGEHE